MFFFENNFVGQAKKAGHPLADEHAERTKAGK